MFLDWKAGIHGPPNRPVFLNKDAGIHRRTEFMVRHRFGGPIKKTWDRFGSVGFDGPIMKT